MKRRDVIVGVALAVVILVGWNWCQRDREDASSATGSAQGRAGTTGGSATGPIAADAKVPAWFGLRNSAPRTIAGNVTFEGKPVSGAIVSLHSVLSLAGVRQIERRTTAADGRFDFGPHAVGNYDLTAEAADKVAAIVHVDLADPVRTPPADQIELRLRACTARLTGVVYDASGGPIARARVRRDNLAGTVADDHGAYSVCLPRGFVNLEYSADGYGSVVLGLPMFGEQQQDIVLVPEGVIAVRVVRDDDGKPVPEALVNAWPQEWGRDRPSGNSAVTDADGRARIGRLVPGQYRAFAMADGLVSQSPVAVTAEVGANPEVVLRLVALARITGKVVAGGKPITDATIVAIRKSPVQRSVPTYTNADGAFATEHVPIGEVVFQALPYEVTSPASFRVDKPQTYDNVTLEVEKLGSIHGRVTKDGKPVEGAQVCCIQTGTFRPQAVTDGDGRYEYRGVPAGTYELGGGSEEAGAFTLSKKFVLTRGEDKVVDLELELAATISGTVVDKDGAPVPGVFVRWTQETTADQGRCISDARGRYRCSAMQGGGKYRSAVLPGPGNAVPYPTADGGPYPSVDLKDGTSVVDNVALATEYKKLTTTGRVVDTTGAGIADADVKALVAREGQPALFNSWMRLPHTFTATDGSFTLADLAVGNYALQARSVDGGEGAVPNVAAGSSGATITIQRAGMIVGKLVGYPALPVVYARPLGGGFRLIAGVVDGDTFSIAALRAGRYLVGAQTTFEGDAAIVEVKAGETTQLTLTANGRGVVDATVLDFRARTPIAGVSCHAVMTVDGQQTLTNWDTAALPKTDASGKVTIEPAPAGSIDVNCIMPSFRWSPPATDTTLAPGGRVAVQLLSVEQTQENPGAAGLQFEDTTATPRIFAVTANGPAATAGLAAGDVVTYVGGTPVAGLNGIGVYNLIESYGVGSSIPIEVLRAGAKKAVTLVLTPHTGLQD